jgi:hypothetical protein
VAAGSRKATRSPGRSCSIRSRKCSVQHPAADRSPCLAAASTRPESAIHILCAEVLAHDGWPICCRPADCLQALASRDRVSGQGREYWRRGLNGPQRNKAGASLPTSSTRRNLRRALTGADCGRPLLASGATWHQSTSDTARSHSFKIELTGVSISRTLAKLPDAFLLQTANDVRDLLHSRRRLLLRPFVMRRTPAVRRRSWVRRGRSLHSPRT